MWIEAIKQIGVLMVALIIGIEYDAAIKLQ